MAFPRFNHDPQERLDYAINWQAWLLANAGDTITASTWSSPDAPLELDDPQEDAGKTVVWLTLAPEAQLGDRYTLTNHITTVAGREKDQSITIAVREA